MEAGATLEPGDNAAPLVEMDNKNALGPAPIPLRLMVEHNVQDPIKKKGHAITALVLVCYRMVLCSVNFISLCIRFTD